MTHVWRKYFAGLLPRGGSLNDAGWERRHKGILLLLCLHAVALPCFGLYMGSSLVYSLSAGVLLFGFAGVAALKNLSRRVSATVATLGLVSSSAILVHLSNGYIEMHFHFFVMLAVIALYQDWIPFLAALLLVVLEHGLMGMVMPLNMYNHAAAQQRPWVWAIIHGSFVFAESAALLVFWRVNELVQQKVLDSEARIIQIIDATPDALIVVNGLGDITRVNRQAETLFGYSREECQNRSIERLLPGSLEEGHAGRLTAYLGRPVSGRGAVSDFVAHKKDGTEFLVEMTLSPLQTADGAFAICALRDVTERKRVEAQLNDYAQELITTNRELDAAVAEAHAATQAKSVFLATMSHEIRTPMNGVIGMTGLLLDTDLSPEQREYAETVRRSGEALLDIINDILDFSKIEAGKVTLETLNFDLRGMVEDVMVLFAERAHAKGLELGVLIQAGVPSAVRGDPGRLRQIVANLVSNAVKFTEHGEVLLTVSMDHSQFPVAEDEVLIKFDVRDTGIGMTSEQCATLFQPFNQADCSTTRKYGGTGLGLAICKQLSELMHGTIGVRSTDGQGSTFWFTSRLGRGTAPAEAPVMSWHGLRGRRVLIVDDSATNRTIVEQQIRVAGMISKSVENGEQALKELSLAAAGGAPFDVALLDMQMPGMDGFDLARRIKAEPAIGPVRLVMLTSFSQRGSARIAQSAGFDAFLTKPIRQVHLLDSLALLFNEEKMSASPTDCSNALITRHTVNEARGMARSRALVVEDNFVNQKVAAKMLEQQGFRVDVAANGREAVEAVIRVPYALVFMDCQMPVMDGFEATRLIREQEQNGGAGKAVPQSARSSPRRRLPIIAMTANALQGDREACLASGMDDYLPKPVRKDDLIAVLDRWRPEASDKPEALQASPSDLFSLPDGDPCVDLSVLAELRSLDATGELLSTLCLHFVEDTPRLLGDMREALSTGDATKLAEIAHLLKGSSGNLGAIHMHRACGDLQSIGRAGRLDLAEQPFEQLCVESNRVIAHLRSHPQASIRQKEDASWKSRNFS